MRVGRTAFTASALALAVACTTKSVPPPDAANAAAESSASGAAAESSGSHYMSGGDSLRFVAHDENLPPGFPLSAPTLALRNPFENDKRAIATGGKLFIAYNCADCHGAGGSGAMGPAFSDGRWHFGGSDAEVFESIYQGRPDGMPAWGGRISNDQVWMRTAYVRSLSSKDVSTENFTGKTIERTGH